MNENTGRPPIDDLFARKLGKMSLPPSPDGFERLQARMGQRQAEPRLVVWRNPTVQRALAIAACLLLVCLFGWLYLRSGYGVRSDATQIATNTGHNSAELTKKKSESEQPADATQSEVTPKMPGVTDNQTSDVRVADAQMAVQSNRQVADGPVPTQKRVKPQPDRIQPVEQAIDEPMLAQQQPVSTDNNVKSAPDKDKHEGQTEAIAVTPVKPTPIERVLVVTIAEPATLVAARQAAEKVTEKAAERVVVASAEKSEKEAKQNGFWQQVRRVKQGEIFASRADNDERGLLGRAYSGLKSNFEKDKSTKQ